MDEASERRQSLAAEERKETSANTEATKTAATKTAFLIADTDSEIQAYALLTLHYCSGMQAAREAIGEDDEEEDDGEIEDEEYDDGITVNL
jgi:hypothetical protein